MSNNLHVIDEIDANLLDELQNEGRISNAALAERIGLSEAPCWRRLKRLESEGIIEGYRAILNRKLLGLGVHAFVHVRVSSHEIDLAGRFEEKVREFDCVLSCHNVTGEVDYILQIVARDLEAYGAFTVVLRNLPGVTAIQSSLCLREIKSTTAVPVGENLRTT